MTQYPPAPPPPPAPNQPPPSSHRLRTGLKWAAVIAVSFGFGACTGALGASSDDGTSSSSATETVTDAVTVTRPVHHGTPSPAQPNSSGGGDTGNALPQTDGDWSLDSIAVTSSLGDFSGTARVTYHGSDPGGGTNLFTVTVFKGGKLVGTLEGSASDVPPGDTTTVSCISMDKYVPGPYRFDFQNNL